ncbi:MAG: hypothetical protein E6H07_17715 [Bacteroidetes bacterium]|nr:MAG: hypothetical protein E6H07_17715 [Bacteroidota bacterium]
MNKFISDRHIVVVLFVLVFITFSLAHEDSKDMERFYSGFRPLPVAEKTALVKSIDTQLSKELGKKSLAEETTQP